MVESEHFRIVQSENSRTIEVRGYWPATTIISLLRQASIENDDSRLMKATPVLEGAVKNLFAVIEKGGVITGTGRIAQRGAFPSSASLRNSIPSDLKAKLGYRLDPKDDKVIPVVVLGEAKKGSMPRIEGIVGSFKRYINFALKENDIKPEDARIDPDSLARLVLAEAAVKWGKGNVTPQKKDGGD